MSYNDIDFLARHAYGLGIDPVDYAEGYVTSAIDVHLNVAASRFEDPATFPGYCLDLTTGALARRIVGILLDAGWTPPEIVKDPS
jgi:hypothetical protein